MRKRPLSGDSAPPSLVLIGLGNPGVRYSSTHHNAGQLIVERFVASQPGFSAWTACNGTRVARGVLGDHPVLALLPNTFMNLSGVGVSKAAKLLGLRPQQCLVFHDDIDLQPGRVKFKCAHPVHERSGAMTLIAGPPHRRLHDEGSSTGGHRGVESIVASFSRSQPFWRCRIGVGRPKSKDAVPDWVLEPFAPDELTTLTALAERLATQGPVLPEILTDPKAPSRVLNALAVTPARAPKRDGSSEPPTKRQQSWGASSLAGALPAPPREPERPGHVERSAEPTAAVGGDHGGDAPERVPARAGESCEASEGAEGDHVP